MVRILIHEFHSFISVKIFEGGEFPRVRSTGRLDGLHKILKNEFAHFRKWAWMFRFLDKTLESLEESSGKTLLNCDSYSLTFKDKPSIL
mgnify:CR=1 FL=1